MFYRHFFSAINDSLSSHEFLTFLFFLFQHRSEMVRAAFGTFNLLCLVGWLVSKRPRQQLGYIADGPRDNFTHETELGDHEFCLSRY